MSGSSETIRFESEPEGASVRIDGGTYTTPTDVKLTRAKNHYAYFELPGYLPVEKEVLQSSNPWLFGNILLGGLIGLAVDASSGASNDLTPDVVRVILVREDPVHRREEGEGVPPGASDEEASDGEQVDDEAPDGEELEDEAPDDKPPD